MPSPEALNSFIAKVETNAHAEAIEQFYAPNASMRTRMDELAYQRWEGDQVVEEDFFYDPGQVAARS